MKVLQIGLVLRANPNDNELMKVLLQLGQVLGASPDDNEIMKVFLQIERVPRASLHIYAPGSYSICSFGSIIDNYEWTLPI